MPIDNLSKSNRIIHLLITDVDTAERMEFRTISANVKIVKNLPDQHALGWPSIVNDDDSYNRRCQQIEGSTYTININAETSSALSEVIYTQPETDPESSLEESK